MNLNILSACSKPTLFDVLFLVFTTPLCYPCLLVFSSLINSLKYCFKPFVLYQKLSGERMFIIKESKLYKSLTSLIRNYIRRFTTSIIKLGDCIALASKCGPYKGSERVPGSADCATKWYNFKVAWRHNQLLTCSSKALWVSDCWLVTTQVATMQSTSIVAHNERPGNKC